ncbi:MAG TPA: hypothetical protein VFB49_00440 [Patescibacteria group bacterium]|nr:hypothetical protein [Patescibacteria group bacterium]
MAIPEAVQQLLAIVERLRTEYPSSRRRFTLDGRLVGDIGEVLAGQMYDITLHDGQTRHHDATARDGRSVQIKATMQNAVTFPVDHTPDYLVALKIHGDGSVTEIFNGPGLVARKAVINRKPTKTNLHSIQIRKLAELNVKVEPSERIPKK